MSGFTELAGLVTVRPIDQWPGELTPASERRLGHFSAYWSTTATELARELKMLDARDAVLELAITERDLRTDGLPRANARPAHPGVILSFEAPGKGPMRFATDQFGTWQECVRAIALGLEALRRVERYGITQSGDPYRGWLQLEPPGSGPGPITTREEAARFIAEQAGEPDAWRTVLELRGPRREAYRQAARRLHPDTAETGDEELFKRLQQARDLLEGRS